REAHVYVAAATMSEIPCADDGEVAFTLCVGNCQKWGAAELLEQVLDADGVRRANDEAGFAVIAKRCLDRCADAPVVQIRTSDGQAGLAPASRASLEEALAELG
ncbi:MAG: hypothetical protein KC457_35365, partial [Myxococcales bacterium]|nr:hypothetical protein [Myxococcales bacterium]